METTEKIVEAYCRYIKGWATIPNIKCKGQFEIDLIAIDPKSSARYHIETGVSISGGFSKLTARKFSTKALKTRVGAAKQRRSVGYFTERKFGSPEVVEKLKGYGFKPGKYKKVIVTWGWTEEAEKQAKEKGVVLWDFRQLLREIAGEFSDVRIYFTDDTLRTLQLFAKTIPAGSSPEPSGARRRSAKATISKGRPPKKADFERELRKIFKEAEQAGHTSVDVTAKALHKRLGGYPKPFNRMPACCDAMYSEMGPKDKVLSAPKSGKGASLTIRYRVPRP